MSNNAPEPLDAEAAAKRLKAQRRALRRLHTPNPSKR